MTVPRIRPSRVPSAARRVRPLSLSVTRPVAILALALSTFAAPGPAGAQRAEAAGVSRQVADSGRKVRGGKSEELAVLLSIQPWVPFPGFGLGSYYAGNPRRGLLHTGIAFGSAAAAVGGGFADDGGLVTVGFLGFVGNWIASWFTAAADARARNCKVGARTEGCPRDRVTAPAASAGVSRAPAPPPDSARP